MNDNHAFTAQRKNPAGFLESTLQKLFTRSASIMDIADIGRTYRLITLEGDALRDIDWTPGDKIQLQLGGWVQRTYTPIDWDTDLGRTRILVYLHAEGPGTQWARTVRQGDECAVFGPRKSISLESSLAPAIMFGDETSLGLAAALSACRKMHVLLEVSSYADTLTVLDQLGLTALHVFARREGDAHLTELEVQISALLRQDAAAEIVLSGRAGAIQQISRFLRKTDLRSGRRHNKAYWANGKTGLD